MSKALEGAIFVYPGHDEAGYRSFHFDRLPQVDAAPMCYPSFVGGNWRLGDGTKLGHKLFDRVIYNKAKRMLTGILDFRPTTFAGDERQECTITFNEGFTSASAEITCYKLGGEIWDPFSLRVERLDAQATAKYKREQAARIKATAEEATAKYKLEKEAMKPVLAVMEKAVDAHNKDSNSFTFFFLDADRLRSWKPEDGPLKSFQEFVVNEPGWLIQEPIDFGRLLRGEYASSCGVASHRWKKQAHPDEDCEQLEAISEWLKQPINRTVRRLWVDYSCLPQGENKTKLEKEYFGMALDVINLLYVGLRVVILLDRSYFNRFWCNYEAFLSMQTAHNDGIQSSEGDFRYSVVCQGSAKGKEKHWIPLLCEWKSKSTKEALEELAKDDIEVTNMSDKTKQIKKLATLNEDVKKLWEQTKP